MSDERACRAELLPAGQRAAPDRGLCVGAVGTDVTGTSAIVGAVVPLPFIARVQGVACDRMAGQLRTFFTGADDTGVSPTVKKTASAQ